MQAIFEGGFVGFALIDDIRSGVINRYLVTPVSRSAILLGKSLRDTTIILMQCLLITFVALPFGLSLNPAGFLAISGSLRFNGHNHVLAVIRVCVNLQSRRLIGTHHEHHNSTALATCRHLPSACIAPVWLADSGKSQPLRLWC